MEIISILDLSVTIRCLPNAYTTNKSFGQWGELMGDNAIATATLDRLLHHAEVVIMKGESYRIKKRSKLGLVPPNQLSSAK